MSAVEEFSHEGTKAQRMTEEVLFRPFVSLCLRVMPLFLLISGSVALGQPKPGYDPTSTHIFPAGGRRGTIVKVRVGTECAPPRTRFHLSGTGVAAPEFLETDAEFRGEPSPRRLPTEVPITYPREWESQITIADDAPLGTAFWRLSCAQGGTSSRPFIIGDLPEFIETESNSVPASAEPISLPVTVNGQICGERDVDYFRFQAKAGEVISCEVVARRLGSILDPVVQLLDSGGEPVDVDEAHVGDDPILVLKPDQDGEYLLRVANVSFQGDAACVYRINLTKRPFLLHAFPSSGRGETMQPIEMHVIDGTGELQMVKDNLVLFPRTPADPLIYKNGQLSGSALLHVDATLHDVDSESNDQLDEAQLLKIPRVVCGRFLNKADQDCFRFQTQRGQRYTILCQAARRGGECLPRMALLDSGGKELKAADCLQSPDGIARIEWQAPADAEFFVRARHLRFGVEGGPGFGYRLSIQPAEPSFSITLNTDNFSVTQDKDAQLEVAIQRQGGFAGPVELKLEGIPQDVTLENTTIPAKKDKVKLKVKVAADVPASSYALRLSGRAEIDGVAVERLARAQHLGVDSERVSIGPAALEQFNLTVRHKPVFRLYCAEAYQYAHRGTVYPYGMEIERLDGFDGEIVVQRGDRQNRDMDGIEFLTTPVGPTRTQFVMPIYLPETMHINVQSQSQLYTQAYSIFTDKHGQQQSVLVLSEKRNMIRTLPPIVKLKAIDTHLQGRPGETIECRLQVERTSNFLGPMQLTLIDVEGTPCSAQPVSIPSGARRASIMLTLKTDLPAKASKLRFRAVGQMPGETKVVTEATTELLVRK